MLIKKLFLLFFTFNTLLASEENTDLEKKINALNIPDDKVTPVLSEDKLYIVNTRYSSLVNRHEITLQAGNNFTAQGHLSTQQAALAYRYHLNSTWSSGLRYTRYANKLSDSGAQLFQSKKILPDTDYALNGQEIFVNYNALYGKLRWSQESVVYFDQYIALGAGRISLASGNQTLAFADVGLSFWPGKHLSARLGLKNEFYKETQKIAVRNTYNAIGYLELGYLFGTGDRE